MTRGRDWKKKKKKKVERESAPALRRAPLASRSDPGAEVPSRHRALLLLLPSWQKSRRRSCWTGRAAPRQASKTSSSSSTDPSQVGMTSRPPPVAVAVAGMHPGTSP